MPALTSYSFGRSTPGQALLTAGWSNPEPGFCWTAATESRLQVPLPPGAGTLLLEISLMPLTHEPNLPAQRLILLVNGVVIARETLVAETTLTAEIPADAQHGLRGLNILLQTPDAAIPAERGVSADTRRLGIAIHQLSLIWQKPQAAFPQRLLPPPPMPPGGLEAAVRGLTALSIELLAPHFESLGHNCEFGLAQRRMGVEQPGLLRFAGTSPIKLLQALDSEFDGIDAPENLEIAIRNPDGNGDEYFVRDRRYGIFAHTYLSPDAITAEAVKKLFSRRLEFLRRKLLEDLRSGGKILVFHHPAARSPSRVLALHRRLRGFGPNALLFLVDEPGHPPGTVQQLEKDLYCAWVGRLEPVHEMPAELMPGWIIACANTYRLWRSAGFGA